ncbi:hypothetical protein K488DRAFT_12809, partial [Vararia minispora EC-137]
PPPASLAHRADISARLAGLGHPHPHTPFYNLRAHRQPTLWSLYRPLRLLAPDDHVRLRIRRLFERWRNLTSPRLARVQLDKAHRFLDRFRLAAAGDEHWQAVLARYARMVRIRFDKEHMARLIRDEIVWRRRLSTRPILTGAPMRPTLFHGPLPRMKRQPAHISGIISARIRARAKRARRQAELRAWREDLRVEAAFEDALDRSAAPGGGGGVERVFRDYGFVRAVEDELEEIQAAFARDEARKSLPFPPRLLVALRRAKRERIHNKRREIVREKRGEETASARRRARKGYPVGVACRWGEKRRREMEVVRRSVAGVGYIGELKRRMGFR